jgi:hypothetical protein
MPTRSRELPSVGCVSLERLNARLTTRLLAVDCEEASAYSPAIVLFPTPPFPLATTTTFFTFGIDRFCMGPPLRGIWGAGFACFLGRPRGFS